jgi:hypothetical protein
MRMEVSCFLFFTLHFQKTQQERIKGVGLEHIFAPISLDLYLYNFDFN